MQMQCGARAANADGRTTHGSGLTIKNRTGGLDVGYVSHATINGNRTNHRQLIHEFATGLLSDVEPDRAGPRTRESGRTRRRTPVRLVNNISERVTVVVGVVVRRQSSVYVRPTVAAL